MELVHQQTNNPELTAQEMVCTNVLVAVVEALNRGACKLTVHADGDVKTDLGGWADDTDIPVFTSSTIRSAPAPAWEVARVLGEVPATCIHPLVIYALSLLERQALLGNTSLQELLLVRHKLDSESLQPLCDALVLNQTLQHLHLGQNRLGDCHGLAQSLGSLSCGLRELHLTRCGISPRGVAAIAVALTTNRTLRELHIGNNRAGDAGAEAMARSLQQNRTLAVLGLASNGVGNAGAVALADAISSHNRSLVKLELQSNEIGAKGTARLAQALCENTTLRSFTMQVRAKL
jgi:Ran GTPase-activating protein (RanGAP) involved in mRNA processing and transport